MNQIWGVSELALQLPLDRVLKKLLHNKTDAKKQSTASSQEVYVQLCGSKLTEEMYVESPPNILS